MNKVILVLAVITVGLGVGVFFWQQHKAQPIHKETAEQAALTHDGIPLAEDEDSLITNNEQTSMLEQQEVGRKNAFSSDNIEVLAAFILNNKPQAFIKDKRSSIVELYTMYDHLDDACIIDISLDNVTFLHNGKKEVSWVRSDINSSAAVQELSPYDIIVNKSAFYEKVPSINALMRNVKLIPHIERGCVSGFRITRIKQGEILSKVGIRENDIVRSINGVQLNDLRKAYNSVLEMVSNNNVAQIQVEVERNYSSQKNSPRQTLTYTIF